MKNDMLDVMKVLNKTTENLKLADYNELAIAGALMVIGSTILSNSLNNDDFQTYMINIIENKKNGVL